MGQYQSNPITSRIKEINEVDAIPSVKLLVLGDPGVGKTSLVHRWVGEELPINPSWTVGGSIQTKLHKYTPDRKEFFIEFWDIGGSAKHANTRYIFYKMAINGVVLVHDLSNGRSFENLPRWLKEFASSFDPESLNIWAE
eukprot:TRINITY_DN5412_c0_g1_i9.p1 TRINITY_DN5412_c0_g1~~TRINITY_DN5412_c0_g1_i9.p1  ORF type:complete len:140 (-),score=18.55 TRINITY_DN5412_c0_g1_i9:744-1163(-)